MAAVPLSTVDQVIWPRLECKGGLLVELRMNRPGITAFNPTTQIFLNGGTSPPSPKGSGPQIANDIELSQRFLTTQGNSAIDQVTIEMLDVHSYTGTGVTSGVSSGYQTEDFTSANSTFLTEWLNIKGTVVSPLLYRVYLTLINAANSTHDTFFYGLYDANLKPQQVRYIYQPETANEMTLSMRTLIIPNYLSILTTVEWQTVLAPLSASTTYNSQPLLVQGDFYNGFVPTPAHLTPTNNSIDGVFATHDGSNSRLQAVPYILVQPGSGGGWQNGVGARSVNAQGFDGRFAQSGNTTPWPAAPWLNNPVTVVTVQSGGTGYALNDTGTIGTGDGTATYKVTGESGGIVSSVSITYGGTGYQVLTNSGTVVIANTLDGGAQPGVGVGLTLQINNVGYQWGPWGTWGISIPGLLYIICNACGIDTTNTFSGQFSALDVYQQKADATHFCFPLDTIVDVPAADQWVNFNIIAGFHPLDGGFWSTPVTPGPNTPVLQMFQAICDYLLCIPSISYSYATGLCSLTLTPIGSTTGTAPTWILGNKNSEELQSNKTTSVQVTDMGDNLTIVAPLIKSANIVLNTSVSRAIPFRLREIGLTSPQTRSANSLDEQANLVWDTSIVGDQATGVFECAELNDGDTQVINYNNDCWKGLTGVYYHRSTYSGNSMYPSIWPEFDWWNAWDGSAYPSAQTQPSFFVLGAQYRHGDTPVAYENNIQRFDTRNFQAVALSSYLVPGQTRLVRHYTGILAGDGTISGVGLGFHKTWFYDKESQTFAAIELTRRLRAGTSTVAWQNITGASLPDIMDIPHGPLVGSGGTSSSSTSSNNAGGGGNGVGSGATIDPVQTLTIFAVSQNNVVISAFTEFIRVSSSVALPTTPINITGLAGGIDGRKIKFINVGSNPIVFPHASGSSTLGNRFRLELGSNRSLMADGSLGLWFDATSNCWRETDIGG